MFSFVRRILSRVRGLSLPDTPPPSTTPPGDPHAGVREPRPGGRPGGSSAVALAEPDDERDRENTGISQSNARLRRGGGGSRYEG